jgi:hypothetical protein
MSDNMTDRDTYFMFHCRAFGSALNLFIMFTERNFYIEGLLVQHQDRPISRSTSVTITNYCR